MSMNISDLQPGTRLGITPWFKLEQQLFSSFETLTKSNDPLHMDPAWVAKNTRFQSTIAPGFLVVSLLPYFQGQVINERRDFYPLNYGFDRIRWIEPVPVDSRIRAEFVIQDIHDRPDSGKLFKTLVTIEIEGVERPAMVAQWLGVILPTSSAQE